MFSSLAKNVQQLDATDHRYWQLHTTMTFSLDTACFSLALSVSKANEVSRITCKSTVLGPWQYALRPQQTNRYQGLKSDATMTQGNIQATKYILEQ